jgi:site-specific recombinase XerD
MAQPSAHRSEPFKPPVLSAGQVNQIIAVANRTPRWLVVRDVVEILYYTGIRANELSCLCISDVDFANNFIHVAAAENCRCGRCVPASPEVIGAINRLHAKDPASCFVIGDSPRAFLYRARRDFCKLTSRMGMRNVSLHTLRLSCAVGLVSSGVDAMTVMRLMGYSSPRVLSFCVFDRKE